MSATAAELLQMVDDFAAAIDTAVTRHPTPDVWRPGTAADDRHADLDDALAAAGWDDLSGDASLLPFVGRAAYALGRRLAPLAPVDRLLGGPLLLDGLVRYPCDGAAMVTPVAGRLELHAAERRSPRAYGDALAVAHVGVTHAAGTVEGAEAQARMDAWIAGSTGYLAGLAAEGLRLARDHTGTRIAFGRPLSALEPVQQLLADAAVLASGIDLLLDARVTADGLAHAGDAARRALLNCQQVTGAIGFTLEFPLQRVFRRAVAAQTWADAALRAWTATP